MIISLDEDRHMNDIAELQKDGSDEVFVAKTRESYKGITVHSPSSISQHPTRQPTIIIKVHIR